LSIRASFYICCVIYTFFSCFEQIFLCFAQFGGGSRCLNFDSLRANFPGRSGGGAGKGRTACDYVSEFHRLNCRLSANQREAETSANVNIEKHVKSTRQGQMT